MRMAHGRALAPDFSAGASRADAQVVARMLWEYSFLTQSCMRRTQATQEKVGALMQLAEANKRAKGRASPAAAKQPGGSGWRVRGTRALLRARLCSPPCAQQPVGLLHGLCVSHAQPVMHSNFVRQEGRGGGHDPGSPVSLRRGGVGLARRCGARTARLHPPRRARRPPQSRRPAAALQRRPALPARARRRLRWPARGPRQSKPWAGPG